jgi:glycosyltransferase involved in cell wall biosynthesis
MRIVLGVHQFFPRYSTGTEVYTLQIAREMRRRGHEVTIVTHDPTTMDAYEVEEGIVDYRYDDFPVHAIRSAPSHAGEGTRFAYDSAGSERQFAALIARLAPDLVHFTHLMHLGIGAPRALLRSTIPYLVTLTDFFALCPRITLIDRVGQHCRGPLFNDCIWCMTGSRVMPPHSLALPEEAAARYLTTLDEEGLVRADEERAVGQRYRLVRYALERAGALIAPTRALRDIFVRNGYRAERLMHLPLGVEQGWLAGYTHTPSDTEVRIGFLGSVVGHKGPQVLVDAFRRLPHGHARLEIWGAMPDPDDERHLRAIAGDDRRITVHGRFAPEDQPGILARLDIVVVPSLWYENTPLVLCAAVLAGIPVIGSDVGGITELVAHNKNGLVFPPGDVEALRAALACLVDDPLRLQRLRGQPPPRVVPTPDEEGAHLEALYRDTIGGAASTTPPKGDAGPH